MKNKNNIEEEIANIVSNHIADEIDQAILYSLRMLNRTPEEIHDDEANEIVRRLKEGIKPASSFTTQTISISVKSRQLKASWSVEETTDTIIIRKNE